MNEEIIGAIKARLENSKNIVVAAHVRPDGDAIGSLLGLGLAQGVHFTLTNRAPMGDPIAVRIAGTKVAIRKAQAELITAEPDA